MKDWKTLEPDVYRLMNKNYTPGRGGHSIRYIVRHHTAGVLTTEQVWNVWQTRQASANYIVEPSGRIGQLVNDWDTSWANANATANAESITIEHSNSAGPGQDWPISDATIEEGAHLAAALCRAYNLGRPEFGKNIKDHKDFWNTSCPYHLARGGKYHQRYMDRSQYWYDHATNPTPEEGPFMALSDAEQRELFDMTRRIHHELTYGFQSRYVDPESGERSEFRDTLVGYALEADRKLESMNAERLPAIENAIDKE